MPRKKTNYTSKDGSDAIDFANLYDNHAEYYARRVNGSFEQERIATEVKEFKVPNLVCLLPRNWTPRRIIEIGCATGELIAAFPVASDGHRVGVDISYSNILSARERFPDVEFYDGNFASLPLPEFDCVILSDILEHVEDDVKFLAEAAGLGRYVLVNLPLEDNWLNWGRNYGVNDASGHLRKYTLEQGLDLLKQAGLDIIEYRRIWVHEAAVADKLRQQRYCHTGHFYNGGPIVRVLKQMAMAFVCVSPLLGRRLFASNLFAIANKSPSI